MFSMLPITYLSLSLWPLIVSAGITLSIQDSVNINAPATVTWNRQQGDPVQFRLQSILFGTSLSTFPDIQNVTTQDDVLTGTLQMTSKFAGPHVVVALNPISPSGMVATSNQFQVVDPSKPGSQTSPTTGNTPNTPTNPTTPNRDAPKCSSQAGVIVGGVLGALAIVSIAIIIILFLRRRQKSQENRHFQDDPNFTMKNFSHPSDTLTIPSSMASHPRQYAASEGLTLTSLVTSPALDSYASTDCSLYARGNEQGAYLAPNRGQVMGSMSVINPESNPVEVNMNTNTARTLPALRIVTAMNNNNRIPRRKGQVAAEERRRNEIRPDSVLPPPSYRASDGPES